MGLRDKAKSAANQVKETLDGGLDVLKKRSQIPDMTKVRALAVAHPDWLSRPLKEFQVATSHNTYMGGLQFGSCVSVEALQNSLDLGARCIELDVFRDKKTDLPVVGHGAVRKEKYKLVSNSVPFEDCVRGIMAKAFTRTDDPLFIMVENNTLGEGSSKCGDAMADTIEACIPKERLLPPGTDLTDWRMRDLLGKVVVCNGGQGGDGRFMKIFTMSVPNGVARMTNLPASCSPDNLDANVPTRIYPCGNLPGFMSLSYDTEPFPLSVEIRLEVLAKPE